MRMANGDGGYVGHCEVIASSAACAADTNTKNKSNAKRSMSPGKIGSSAVQNVQPLVQSVSPAKNASKTPDKR